MQYSEKKSFLNFSLITITIIGMFIVSYGLKDPDSNWWYGLFIIFLGILSYLFVRYAMLKESEENKNDEL